jgi:DNA (cytosine-5)-methyltransferase 1
VDSFSGAGGLSLGLSRAGFDVVSAFDWDERAIDTYRANLGAHGRLGDATALRGTDLFDGPGELDLFAGGPPCQGFSKQKRGAHLGDERNRMVLEFARLVDELNPRFFLLENVATFGQKRGREFVRSVRERLSNYVLAPHFYNSADFGLAQTRERFIIVGKRDDVGGTFSPPNPTVDRWKTVGEALSGIPSPPLDYSHHPDFPNHQRARVSAKNIERFSHVPQGGGWQDIPFELRLKCHQRVDTSSGGWPDVYGRLESDGQAPTITGGFDSFTRGRYGHPHEDRPITPREAARLQGFPDEFQFVGTRADVRRQIGNAVPPPLARAIGVEIIAALESDREAWREEDAA